MKQLCSILVFFVGIGAFSKNRIDSFVMDRSEVFLIEMAPKLATKLIIHCPVDDIVLGRNGDFRIALSSKTKKEMTITSSKNARPTNLIITCFPNKYFVFDLVSNSKIQRDIVFIKDSFLGKRVNFKKPRKTVLYSRIIKLPKTKKINLKGAKI